jgi:hypothetical protein
MAIDRRKKGRRSCACFVQQLDHGNALHDFEEFLEVQKLGDIHWTTSVPRRSSSPAKRNGTFHLGKDQLITDEKGDSRISLEDHAIAWSTNWRSPSIGVNGSPSATNLTVRSLRATAPVKNTHNPCCRPSGFHSSHGRWLGQ